LLVIPAKAGIQLLVLSPQMHGLRVGFGKTVAFLTETKVKQKKSKGAGFRLSPE